MGGARGATTVIAALGFVLQGAGTLSFSGWSLLAADGLASGRSMW